MAQARTKIVKLADLDLTEIKHHALKTVKYKNGKQSSYVPITYNNGAKVLILIPKTKVPFGVTVGMQEDADKKQFLAAEKFPKCSLELNLGEAEEAKIRELDELNIAYISDSSESLLGKKTTAEVVRNFVYHTTKNSSGSMIKINKAESGDFPNRLKIKLPTDAKTGAARFKVYDEHNKKLECPNRVHLDAKGNVKPEWEWDQQQMQVDTICELECMWDVSGKYYCSMKALQLRVYPAAGELQECAFDAIDGVDEVTEGVEKVDVVDEEEAPEEHDEAEAEDPDYVPDDEEDEDLMVEED